MFAEGGRVAVVCAVTGARGVGKTQIAAAYARQQVVAGCPLVGWVSGESTDVLVAGLAEVARALGVADPEGDSMVSARRVRAHLESCDESALLVVDNAVDADAVRRCCRLSDPPRWSSLVPIMPGSGSWVLRWMCRCSTKPSRWPICGLAPDARMSQAPTRWPRSG